MQNDSYRDRHTEDRSGVTHSVHDSVRANVVHLDHLVQATGQEAARIRVECQGRDCLLVI